MTCIFCHLQFNLRLLTYRLGLCFESVFIQVIPVDSRGEALLVALHSPPSPTSSQGRGSLISFEEEDDSACVHSSTEDLGRKVSIMW